MCDSIYLINFRPVRLAVAEITSLFMLLGAPTYYLFSLQGANYLLHQGEKNSEIIHRIEREQERRAFLIALLSLFLPL